MENFSEKCKIYLKHKNFIPGINIPRHSKILWTDAVIAFIYSAVSVILIWLNIADIIVLGLNILCLFRAMISNKLSEYEIIESSDIENDFSKYSRYHIRIIIICIVTIYSILIWSIFVLKPTLVTTILEIGVLIKSSTSIAILVVLGNDWEDIVIYAFDATVRTTTRT